MKTDKNYIVDFMELKPIEVFGKFSISKDHVSVNCDTFEEAYQSFCKSTKYDTDWNWLMQVVEKIESIEEQRFLFQISSRQGFYAEVRERFFYDEKIEDSWGNSRIEAVYKTVVEFIKWYDENKTK